jgi:hypothetical protein
MPKKWGIQPNIQKRSSDSGFSLENRRQGVDRALKSVISKTFCKRLYEVEIVMQTLGLGVLQETLAGLLVVPGLKRRTRLHCREDMHQPWMIPSASDDLLDAFLFAEILATNKLDFQTVVSRHLLCVFPNLLSQRFCEFGVIEDADVVAAQVTAHSIGVADIEDCSSDHDTIKTRDNPMNLVGILLSESSHRHALRNALIHAVLIPTFPRGSVLRV